MATTPKTKTKYFFDEFCVVWRNFVWSSTSLILLMMDQHWFMTRVQFSDAYMRHYSRMSHYAKCWRFGLIMQDPNLVHYDVIKWKYFPRNWPFVRGIHRGHKGQWRRALMFSLIWVWINDWVNNREAGDLRCYRADYDVIVMITVSTYIPALDKHVCFGENIIAFMMTPCNGNAPCIIVLLGIHRSLDAQHKGSITRCFYALFNASLINDR